VITIRYRDLPSGMHARAEYAGRSTAIYLQPGLTGAQRAAAVRRLRQEARMGCGPSLPCARLALACAADWIKCGVRQLMAIVRLHPVGTMLPALLLSVMAGLFLYVSMPALPTPADPGQVAQSTVTCATSPELAAKMLVAPGNPQQCDSVPVMPALVSGAALTPSR
jgi:hypothetical protein